MSAPNPERLRRLDAAVRRVARGGRGDSAWINFEAHLNLVTGDTLRLRATFGAGTNTAEVRHSQHGLVYEGHGYGRHVTCFRAGRWVAPLLALASDREDEQRAEEALRDATAQVDRERRFEPLKEEDSE